MVSDNIMQTMVPLECLSPKTKTPTGPPPVALVPIASYPSYDAYPTRMTSVPTANVGVVNLDGVTSEPSLASLPGVPSEPSFASLPGVPMEPSFVRSSFNRGYEIIEGCRWYYRLVPQHDKDQETSHPGWGLLDEHPINTLDGWLVVCLVVLTASLPGRRHTENKKPTTLLYSAFRTYVEFYHYMLKFAEHKRSFFEIILGEYAQKPHFDVDIDLEDLAVLLGNVSLGAAEEYADSVFEALVDAIVTVLAKYGIAIDPKEDILEYTSHGVTKRSYHVLVGRYCHPNNTEAKAFYAEVVAAMDKDKAKWVDKSVYSPRQQFRLLGSQKLGSMRPKRYHPTWRYHGQDITHCYLEAPDSQEHEALIQFEESLVSQTSSCTMLPMIGDGGRNDLRSLTRTGTFDDPYGDPDLEPNLAREALKTVRNYGKATTVDFPYQLTAIKGNLLILKRLHPSRCPICCRVHEHENPFLTVGPNNDGLRSVYFHCRRADIGTRLLVGTIVDQSQPADNTAPQAGHPSDGSLCGSNSQQVLTIGQTTMVLPSEEPRLEGGIDVTGSGVVTNVNRQHRDAVSSFLRNSLVNRVNQLATQPTPRPRKVVTELDPDIARQLMMDIMVKRKI